MKKLFLVFILGILCSSVFALSLKNDFFLDISAGVTGMLETRIVDQAKYNRSNFVYEDFLGGLNATVFFGRHNYLIGSYFSASILYPLQHKFNKVPVKYINVINLSADMSIGATLILSLFDFLQVDLILGVHYNFLWEDRFKYSTLGPEIGAHFGIKTYKRQMVDVYYVFALDIFDLGNNNTIEPLKNRFMHKFGVGYRF